MSKRTAKPASEHGAELLRQWGVGGDAESLAAAWGRDPQADAGIVEALARLESEGSAAALASLEHRATDKSLRKEIRRALFRFEQRGLAVPKAEPAANVVAVAASAVEGYISASDGNGDQLLWLVKPRRGELLQLFAVINDPNGMREAELHPVTRKVLRAAREDLESKHAIRIVDVAWHYCDQRMYRAHTWAAERGVHIHGDYLGLRNQLLSEPPADAPHPIFSVLDAAAIRGDAVLLEHSAPLVELPELRTWFFPPEALESYLDEVRQAQSSPLLLNEHQTRDRLEQIAARAVEEIFSAGRESYHRRLLDLAWVLHATRRQDAARQTVAVALALEASTRGGAGIPFCEALVRVSMGAHLRASAERDQERARESLIVTPQEAARAAAARRSQR